MSPTLPPKPDLDTSPVRSPRHDRADYDRRYPPRNSRQSDLPRSPPRGGPLSYHRDSYKNSYVPSHDSPRYRDSYEPRRAYDNRDKVSDAVQDARYRAQLRRQDYEPRRPREPEWRQRTDDWPPPRRGPPPPREDYGRGRDYERDRHEPYDRDRRDLPRSPPRPAQRRYSRSPPRRRSASPGRRFPPSPRSVRGGDRPFDASPRSRPRARSPSLAKTGDANKSSDALEPGEYAALKADSPWRQPRYSRSPSRSPNRRSRSPVHRSSISRRRSSTPPRHSPRRRSPSPAPILRSKLPAPPTEHALPAAAIAASSAVSPTTPPTLPLLTNDASPAATPPLASREKGKAKEELRADWQGVAFIASSAAPLSRSDLPLPTGPRAKVAVRQPSVALPTTPVATAPGTPRQPASFQADRPVELPRRSVSPPLPTVHPLTLKKQLDEEHMKTLNEGDRRPYQLALEAPAKAHKNYAQAVRNYHKNHPGVIAADIRRKVRQHQHELVVTLLDHSAVEQRRVVADALLDKIHTGSLGVTNPTS